MRRAHTPKPDPNPQLDIDHAVSEYRYPDTKRKNNDLTVVLEIKRV